MAFQNKSYITKTHLQSFGTNFKSRFITSSMVNYIVEQGQDSDGTYRKGSDGYCEAGYHYWGTGLTADGNKGAYPVVALPSGLFKTVECIYAGASSSGDTISVAGGCEGSPTQGTGHVRCGGSGSVNIEANLYAVGWGR